jgi:hypothetical protein
VVSAAILQVLVEALVEVVPLIMAQVDQIHLVREMLAETDQAIVATAAAAVVLEQLVKMESIQAQAEMVVLDSILIHRGHQLHRRADLTDITQAAAVVVHYLPRLQVHQLVEPMEKHQHQVIILLLHRAEAVVVSTAADQVESAVMAELV